MKLISSKMTYFYKRVVPGLYFAIMICALLWLCMFQAAAMPLGGVFVAVVGGLFSIITGYVVMRLFIFNLVDEVWDDSDTLVIKNGGEEERIALDDITHVYYVIGVNPRRIHLTAPHATRFGEEIAFLPPIRFNLSMEPPLVAHLRSRIDSQVQSW